MVCPISCATTNSSSLERRLPIENRLSHPRLPLIGRRRIDVVDDRFDRLGQSGIEIFFLQSIARYVRTIRGPLLGRPEIHLRNREEPHALVESPRYHGLLR